MYIREQDICAFHLGNELTQANLKPQISKVDSCNNYHRPIMLCIYNLKTQISKLFYMDKFSRISFV